MSYISSQRVSRHFSKLLANAEMGLTPMTDDQLFRAAPSIFATEAHESRSERFAVIPTAHVVTAMRKEGFEPFAARQSRSRDASRHEYTKHLIRFRHVDHGVTSAARTGAAPEVVLVNANDGTSAYKLFKGVFRVICKNGLVVQEEDHGSVRVPHKGDVNRLVIEGSYEVLKDSVAALETAEDWRGLTLNRDTAHAFAEAAHMLRFADNEGKVTTPIKPEALLAPRRAEDASADLWTTFNVIQENAVRGGLTGVAIDPETRRRRNVSTREVTNIQNDVKLNRALWHLTDRMAAILRR